MPIRTASSSSSVKQNRGRTLPPAPWKKMQSPPTAPSDEAAHRPREVGGVAEHIPAAGDRVAAVADERRDRRLVGPTRLQHRELRVDELVGVPAEHRVPSGPPGVRSRRLTARSRLRLPPYDGRRLQPLGRQPADGDDRVGEHLGVGVGRCTGRIVDPDQKPIGPERRCEVGVAPVQQHAAGSAPVAVRRGRRARRSPPRPCPRRRRRRARSARPPTPARAHRPRAAARSPGRRAPGERTRSSATRAAARGRCARHRREARSRRHPPVHGWVPDGRPTSRILGSWSDKSRRSERAAVGRRQARPGGRFARCSGAGRPPSA